MPTGTFSFYFSWSSQNELAILHNSNVAAELMLDTTSLQGDALADLVAVESGQPLYFSWNPNGGAFAAHIGADRLLTNDLADSTSLDLDPGAFAAPSWTSRGVLALDSGDPRQTLAFIAPDGAATAIASIRGTTNFVPNADGSRIAVQGLAEPSQFQSASLQALPTLPSNRLVVVNSDTGEFTGVTTSPVFAFFWSPQGDQLLVLDVVDGPQARWSVWSESGLEELVRFSPDPNFFTDVVPFFDQYAQSISLWSADGSTIAFAGTIDGQSGIWVQPLDGEPTLVHGGTWVSWAP
jgi:TolB protein